MTTALVTPIPKLQSFRVRNTALFENDRESDNIISMLSDDDSDINGQQKKTALRNEVFSLESHFTSAEEHDDPKRFDPLLGLYEVASVITNNEKENPVGGKWTRSGGFAQKLFRTRKTYQHILPYNSTGLARYDGDTSVAEAINVVSLDGLDGLLRATIILRGDVVPLSSQQLKTMNTNRTANLLSNLAIRANFDSPRIFFGKRQSKSEKVFKYLPLQLGPLSDVVLDTSFVDETVRIGVGGTSGTRFIFTRTKDDDEAVEYDALLQQPPAKKPKLLGTMASIILASSYIAFGSGLKRLAAALPSFTTKCAIFNRSVAGIARIIAGATALLAGLSALLIAFSSGGIERDEMHAHTVR